MKPESPLSEPLFIQKLRAVGRLGLFVFTLFGFIAVVLVSTFFSGKKVETGLRIRARYARFLCRAFRVTIEMRGQPPAGPCLFVAATHRSYFDPVAICSLVEAMPVAKAELADWPIIGYGCRVSGVIPVKREDRASRREALESVGDIILKEKVQALIFAEGTTHSQPSCIELRPGSFRLAARAGIAVVPVAIDFDNELSHFTNDDTFLPHFLSCFGQKRQRCLVAFGKPLHSDDPDILMEKTRSFVDSTLADFRKKSSINNEYRLKAPLFPCFYRRVNFKNSSRMKISVIIPTRNEELVIAESILQYAPFFEKNDLEIIVSDGGSTDKTADLVRLIMKNFPGRVQLVQKTGKQNIAIGRNAGAAAASGEILFHTDADVRLPDPMLFFQRVMAAFSNPKTLATTTAIRVYPAEARLSDRFYHFLMNTTIRLSILAGACLAKGECQLVRRSAFLQVGGYDERLVAGEDCNLFFQIHKNGNVRFLSGLRVFHSPRRFRKYGYWKISHQYLMEGIFRLVANRSFAKEWKMVR